MSIIHNMIVLVKLPSRGRPQQLLDVLRLYVNNAHDMSKMFFMITLDSDDSTADIDIINSLTAVHPNVSVHVGVSGTKIKAVNRDMDMAPYFDILLATSDDMIPIVSGYDEIIRTAMYKHYPSTDGVLWFNDGFQGNGLNTLPIMGRKYYQRFGYIYNPLYKTLWCDKEFTDVSIRLGRQTYFPQVIIEHRHFVNGKAAVDETYIKNNAGAEEDTELYNSRKKIKYGIETGLVLPKIKVKIYK